MKRPKEGWHIGKLRGHLYEYCYGFVITGYSYMGGPEKEPYTYSFWGFSWGGDKTYGVGRVVHDEGWEE